MRGTRWLLLVAILAISAAIGVTYRNRKQILREEAPAKPAMLPTEISGIRQEFHWTRREAGQAKSEISAQKVLQEAGSNQVHLEGVELKIYNKTGDQYDLVKSANADFNQAESRMYSDGEVEVTLGRAGGGAAHAAAGQYQILGREFRCKDR